MIREIASEWAGRRWTCSCGRTHAVPTRQVVVSDDAPERAAAYAARHWPGTIGLLADSVTYQVQGRDVENAVRREERLGSRLVLFEPVAEPDVAYARHLADQAGEVTGLIAVGAGTVNDFAKAAAGEMRVPYACVATAASVNGYTSPIAALMVDGMKSTVECPPPQAVFASPAVLADAPLSLTASGFADLLSKPACQSDWILAHLLLDEWYCPEPGRMVNPAINRVVDQAAAVGRQVPQAVCDLFEALILSGYSMTVAGGSGPASGGEHLISHYWDMMIPKDDLFRRLHGLQVGVGTLVSLAAYETVLEAVDSGAWSIDAREAWAMMEDDLRKHFGHLAGVVTSEGRAKHQRTCGDPEWRARVERELESVLEVVRTSLLNRAFLRDILRGAGAATSHADLGLETDDLLRALRYSRHMRNRFTVFDLAASLGIDPALAAGSGLESSA